MSAVSEAIFLLLFPVTLAQWLSVFTAFYIRLESKCSQSSSMSKHGAWGFDLKNGHFAFPLCNYDKLNLRKGPKPFSSSVFLSYSPQLANTWITMPFDTLAFPKMPFLPPCWWYLAATVRRIHLFREICGTWGWELQVTRPHFGLSSAKPQRDGFECPVEPFQ